MSSRYSLYRKPEEKTFFDPFEKKPVTERNAVLFHATRLLFVETTCVNPPRTIQLEKDAYWFELSPSFAAIKDTWPQMKIIYAPKTESRSIAVYQDDPFYFCRRFEVEEFLSMKHPRELYFCMIYRQEIPRECFYREGVPNAKEQMLEAWGITWATD